MSDMVDVITIDLASDVSGAVQAQKAIQDVAAKTQQLKDQLKAGTIDLATFNYGMSRVAATSKAAKDGFESAMGGATKLGGGFDNAAYKLQLFGGLLDDFQYVAEQGLRPIIGNVMQLSPAIGIALIAGQALYKNWDNLTGIFTGPATRTAAEEMEELGKKTKLTADEAERLARASAVGAKVNDLRGGQTEAQSKQDAAVTAAINQAGFRNVAAGVLKAAPDLVDNQGTAAVAKEALAKAKSLLASAQASGADSEDFTAIGRAEQGVRDAEVTLKDARRQTAENMASTGALAKLFPGGLAQLRGLVEKDPDAFGPNGNQLRGDLKEAAKSPEDIEDEKHQAHYDEQIRANDDRLARIAEQEEERGRQSDREMDLAEQQAREKLAAWQEQGRQAQVDEQVNARAQDMMANHNRNAQVFDGPASLRDSIQGAFGDKTAVEQLALTKLIEASARRQVEQLQAIAQRVGGPARAG